MNLRFTLIIISIILSGLNMFSQTLDSPDKVLPDNINVWKPIQNDRIYLSENLYDYIDGGAELFLSYGFQKVYNRIYGRENQPDIFVDIFFMNTSHDAFGVFSHSRETIEQDWGQGSQYTEGAILFWKNNIYVSILTNPETSQAKETIFEIADIIESAIPHIGELPQVVGHLPEENLIKESVRYFRHHVWLNSFYFISHSNLLHINQDTECVLAKYKLGEDRPLLAILKYKDRETAKYAYDNFIEKYLPEGKNGGAVKIEDGHYTMCVISNEVIKIIFDAKEEKNCNYLMEIVKSTNK